MLWAQSYGWYEQLEILWAMAFRCYELRDKNDMNYYWSWAYELKCYEQLRVVDDMNNSRSWAAGSRCYEQLKVVDDLKFVEDMNDSGSYELRPLDVMNSLRLWMIWTILSCQPMALNAMNNLGEWMTWKSLGYELKALDAMNNSELWLTYASTGCELKALDYMNSSVLSMIRMTWVPISSSL